MKERGIIFTGPMVRAILEDRKTQTRRAVKPQPEDIGFGRNCEIKPYCTGTDWPLAYYERRGACWNSSPALKCPYGDRLWVREAFSRCGCKTKCDHVGCHTIYRADETKSLGAWGAVRWTPPIFMPRWASRLTLEITEVRVQRLHDIGKDGRKAVDVLAEGITQEGIDLWRKYLHPDDAPAHTYACLWDSINGKKHPWESNPWIWAIAFKKV